MSFYSTQEMAAISFNRIRLDHFVSQNTPWALFLKKLLESPIRLFTTTLIGVNVAMMISSECARKLYEVYGFDPNWAMCLEIPFVLLFGELVPMFAARMYPEHACRLGMPTLYATAQLLSPITKAVEYFFSHFPTVWRAGAPQRGAINREELQELLSEHRSGRAKAHMPIGMIFALTSKRAYELVHPFPQSLLCSAQATVADVRFRLQQELFDFVILSLETNRKIIGIARVADLLEARATERVRSYCLPPLFVSENSSTIDLFLKLQNAPAHCAIVMNTQGDAQGIITLHDLIEELFEENQTPSDYPMVYFEKTIPAITPIADLNEAFHLNIDAQGCITTAQLIEKILGRNPVTGETITLGNFDIVIKKTSLFGAKTVLIKSRS